MPMTFVIHNSYWLTVGFAIDMTVSMIVSCPYSIAAMIATFLLMGYYIVRMRALKRIE